METNTKTNDKVKRNVAFMVLGLATEIGFVIAVPLVVLIFIGARLDEKFSTTPLFILLAFVVSIVISSMIIGRKIRALTRLS